jgi:1-deoxy-D-xylulose-5-phosphate reductoisomerase
MKLPIQFAMTYPERVKTDFPRFDFIKYPQLTFEKPDMETFRNLGLAFEALKQGGNMPCVLNAANEVAVALFLKDEISFLGMSDLVEHCMQKVSFIKKPTYEDYVFTDEATRKIAFERLK